MLVIYMKKLYKIPFFNNEEEEREFWDKNDSSEYIDWSKSERFVFPELKPSAITISLRLPRYMLDEIKMIAHERDVPYQSLIKVFLKERLNQELKYSGKT
jgi:predicted DNA binding CopG/RHH family protein